MVDNISQVKTFTKKSDRILGDKVIARMLVITGKYVFRKCYSIGISA